MISCLCLGSDIDEILQAVRSCSAASGLRTSGCDGTDSFTTISAREEEARISEMID